MWFDAGAERLFQDAGLIYADEVPVKTASVGHIDKAEVGRYFERRYHKTVKSAGLALPKLLQNLGLARAGAPNLAGLLLFGKSVQVLKPALVIKAVAFPGTVLHDTRYLDSEDIDGSLAEQYRRALAFIKRNLRHVQRGRGFNSPGSLEVPGCRAV